MAINGAWHGKNPMPRPAKMDDRIRWHLAHAKACGCRPIPASVVGAIRERSGKATGAASPPRRRGRAATG
jgi:hypothetical protein